VRLFWAPCVTSPVTRYLLATASVHTTAAAADYLGPRLDADDEVVVLTVTATSESGDGDDAVEPDTRDAGDAANVARSRLHPATVESVERAGDPATAIRETIAERVVDVLVVGPHRGDPDVRGESPGSTVRALLGDLDVPVVVVPLDV
jgi:nucleotide-binding universal stress UspA family protein